MKKKFAIIITMMSLTLLMALYSSYLYVRERIQVGKKTKQTALVYVEHQQYGHDHTAAADSIVVKAGSSQTGKLLNLKNSSGTTVYNVDTTGTVTSTGSQTYSGATTFSSMVTINDNLLVDGDGVSDVQFRVDGTSGQAVDIVSIRAYDGATEYFDITSAGNVGIKVGVTHTTGNIALKVYTSDPCGTLGNNKGPWLNNTSPSKMCFCDSAGADMLVDGSTDCPW